MRIICLLVIILIIHEDCILAFKFECQAPVPADADRPMILEFPGKAVQLPSRCVQVSRLPSIVKGEQLQTQLAGMFRLNPRFRSSAEKLLHATMAEALDHVYSVTIHAT